MARPLATAEARELRTQQLLDAAVSLWQQNPERVPSVAEVAGKAGVAKGTVYLYFKSKEDLLLAAHSRHVQAVNGAEKDTKWRSKSEPVGWLKWAHGSPFFCCLVL